MKKIFFILMFSPLLISAQNFIHVQIFNKDAIENFLGTDTVIAEIPYNVIHDHVFGKPEIGQTIVVSGNDHDPYWRCIPGILKNDFSFTNYIATTVPGDRFIEFEAERKFFLNGKIVKIE